MTVFTLSSISRSHGKVSKVLRNKDQPIQLWFYLLQM